MIRPYDTWALACLVAGGDGNGELEHVSSPHRRLCDHLATLPLEARQPALTAFLKSRSEAEEQAVILALADIDPEGPPPTSEAKRLTAHLGDLTAFQSAGRFIWQNWIVRGHFNLLSSDPKIGKTHLALDLARRIWLAQPWPDNQPPTFPERTRTLWVCGDRHQDELRERGAAFGLPPEAILLNASPDDPYGGWDLDQPDNVEALRGRVEAESPGLVVIDTLWRATKRKMYVETDVNALMNPIVTMAQECDVAILGLMHLSKDQDTLGRRLEGLARAILKMLRPDPSQPDRRKLMVIGNFKEPPAIGVTIHDKGCDYDPNPPDESGPTLGKRGPAPEKLDACKEWLAECLTPNPMRVVDIRKESDEKGFSAKTLYRAKDDLGLDEYTLDRLKWWKMPVTASADGLKKPVTEDGGSDFDPGDFEEIDGDSSLTSTSVRTVHPQPTSDEKRPGRGRQRINRRKFKTTGP